MVSRSLHKALDEVQDERLRERARRFIEGRNPRYRRGLVAMADDRGRVRWIPWQQAAAQGPTGTPENRIVERLYSVRDSGLITPRPIATRTERQRVESLARRFWDTVRDNPGMAPLVLAELHEEYDRLGHTVSYDDMKRAAISLLRKAAAEMKKGTG